MSIHGMILSGGAAIAVALGWVVYPVFFPLQGDKKRETPPRQHASVIAEPEADAATPQSLPISNEKPQDDEAPESLREEPAQNHSTEADDAPIESEASENETHAPIPESTEENPQEELEDETEEESEEEQQEETIEPLQQVFPPRSSTKPIPARSASSLSSLVVSVRQKLQNQMQKECQRIEKGKACEQRFGIVAERWENPEKLYQELAASLLKQLKNAHEANCLNVLEQAKGRHLVMQLRLLTATGFDGIRQVCQSKKGAQLLARMSGDEDWLSDLLYSGEVQGLQQVLCNLSLLYEQHANDMAQPVLRRMATAVALELANPQEMQARYQAYRAGYLENKLNSIVDDIPCWQLRYVMSMPGAEPVPCAWGSPQNLAWLRDNVKLPIGEYVEAYQHLSYQLRNVAGDSAYSTDYLAPGLKHANYIVAKAQLNMGGGASGAQSYYAAYAAAASGIPAVIMCEPEHFSYAVRTFKGWQPANSRHWKRRVHKTLWGQPTWGALMLTESMYMNRAVSRTADLMLSIADFLVEQEKIPEAGRMYELGIQYQPSHWPILQRYAHFLKNRAADDADKWQTLHDWVLSGIAKKHYQSAAEYVVEYVYPSFMPHVANVEKRVQCFEKLFTQFRGWGSNRWDIAPLLSAQINYFNQDRDKKYFLQQMFGLLLKKQPYNTACLIWGLEYMSQLQQQDSPLCDDVERELIIALRRSKGRASDEEATWAMWGEVCHSAAKNRDITTFQMAGDMAAKRCRKKFPEANHPKLPQYDGALRSDSGLVDTHGVQTQEQMADACLHWAVLQRDGGMMPARFENKQGVLVQLKKNHELTAVVCVFAEEIKSGRSFYLEISDDGRNWLTEATEGQITDNILQFVIPRRGVHARYVRLLREGDRSEAQITHLQVYGR